MATKSKADKQAALAQPAATASAAPKGKNKKDTVKEDAAAALGVSAKPAKPEEPKEPGKIAQILALHKAGKTNQEIVEAGFNKTTVSIQVARYKKQQASSVPA